MDNVVWNQADYEGVEPWPPAASLLDLVRCTVVMDDPYDRTFSGTPEWMVEMKASGTKAQSTGG